MNKIFIAGIGTGVGKTIVSAILTEALEADYWKPVQAGNLEHTDSDIVRSLISNAQSMIHPEAYRLTLAASPHAASRKDKVEIELGNLNPPSTSRLLIIELAGGIMVPLNDREVNVDFVKRLQAPLILVSQNYLGSINHTLLTIEACRSFGIKILGIVFNGKKTPATEEFIMKYSKLPCLGRVEEENKMDKLVIRKYAEDFRIKFPVLNAAR